MPPRATYKKALNVFQDREGSTFIYFKKKRVPVGSIEYKKLTKIYPVEAGYLIFERPFVRGIKFEVKKMIQSYDPAILPEIVLNPRKKNKVMNPFTNHLFDISTKNGRKTYNEFLIIYEKVGNKLVPRAEPTHLVYVDAQGSKRVTRRDSKLVQDKIAPNGGFRVINNTVVPFRRTERQLGLNEQTIALTVRSPIDDLAMHTKNLRQITNLLTSAIEPELLALKRNATLNITVALDSQKISTVRQFYFTAGFLEFHYEIVNGVGNFSQILTEIAMAVGMFDGETFAGKDYTGVLSHFNVLITPSNDAGGCHDGDRLREKDPEDPSVVLVSYQAKENNCLIAILKRNSPQFAGSRVTFNTIRKELGLEIGTPIDYREIPNRHMPDYFGITIHLDRMGELKIYEPSTPSLEAPVEIKLRNGHYYHKLNPIRTNGASSQMAFKANQEAVKAKELKRERMEWDSDDSDDPDQPEEPEFEEVEKKQEVLQPTSRRMRKDPIDLTSVVYVDSAAFDPFVASYSARSSSSVSSPDDLPFDRFDHLNGVVKWLFNGVVYHGKIADLFDFCWKASLDLVGSVYNSSRFKVAKKLIVHCFSGSRVLFSLIEDEILRRTDLNIPFKNKKKKHFAAFEVERIVFYDVVEFFQASFEDLLEHTKDGFEMVPSDFPDSELLLQKKVIDYIFADIYLFFNVHVYDFVSVAGLGETIWKSTLTYSKPDEMIHFMDQKMFKFVLEANYGARNHPLKSTYESSFFKKLGDDPVKNLEIAGQLHESGDYLSVVDSFGAYPASMVNYPYPSGPARWLSVDELAELNGLLSVGSLELKSDSWKLGFLRVRFCPPSDLRIPFLIKHDQDRKLCYDLLPGIGVYSTVELNQALRLGYKITKILEGVVWEQTCSSYFTDYMKKVIQLKCSRSSLRRLIGKLLMNSLYGRMMYRTKHGRAWTCKNLKSLQRYIETHYVTDFQIKDDGSVFISGVDKRAPQKLEVPVHLGCFVLAYSKILMLNFYDTVSPGLTSDECYYTDNDSLFVCGRSVSLLEEKGLLIPDGVDKYDSSEMFKNIGKGKNDIKDGLMIVKAKFLGPKQYYYTYLSTSGKLNTRLVAAGIPGVWINQGKNKDFVLNEYFEKMKPIMVENIIGERLFTPNYWGGMRMNLIGDWYPNGYSVGN